MKPRRKRVLVAVAVFVVALVCFAAWRDGRCGRRVAAGRMTNHDATFDFSAPPCAPAGRPGADVRIAYLGVGGLLIEWRGATLVSAPYFTRQDPLEALLGNLRVDAAGIARGVAGFRPQRWDAILSGHSHYDHLADVPQLMQRHATRATLWTNESGANMLAAFPDIANRVRVLSDGPRRWIRPTDANGEPLPFRFSPIASEHAPHLYGYRYGHGRVVERWSSWAVRPVRSMLDGRTVAFLIDLLDERDGVAFRIHFQDSAGPAHRALPADWIDERAADLAVLCVPPYWNLDGYPERILEASRAPYVLAVHYEDFLQPLDRPLRFVRSLSDERMDGFLERVERATNGRTLRSPASDTCGPSGPHWTMPLPGEWIGFDTGAAAVLDSASR